MKDQNKTKKQLILELTELRQRISECEKNESERGQAEEALQQVQAYTESILGSMTDTYILFDQQWRYLYVNEAAVRAIGRQREQILGHTLWELYPDIVGTELDRQYHRSMDERVPLAFDFHYPTTDTWWKNRFYPAPEGLTVLATDITARERMEERLREYERVVENSQDMIAVVDKNYKYVVANARFLKYRGLGKDQVVGRSIRDILGEDVFDKEVKKNLEASFRGEVVQFEMKFHYPELGERILLVQYFPLTNHEGINEIAIIIQDITDRKQVEEALIESERRFRLAMDATSDGLWEWDVTTGATYYSPAYFRMLGYEAEELTNTYQTWADLIHPDDREHALAVNHDCIENRRETFSVEFRMRAKSGEWRWILGRGKAAKRDASGSALLMIGTHVDITAGKQAEERLREEKDGAQRYLDVAGVMFVALDAHQKVVLINKKGCEILEYKEEDIIGKKWHDNFLPERDRERLGNSFAKLMAGDIEPVEYLENPVLTKSGKERMIAWYNTVIKDGAGNIIRTLSSGEDITDRKRTEQVLIETNQELRALINASPLAIVSQDYRRNVLEWNPAAERIFGWREEEVLGKPTPIVPEDKKEEFQNIFEKILKGNTVSGLETHRQTKDGVLVDVRLSSATLYGSDGRPKGNVTLLEDVTEYKKRERENTKLIEQLRKGRERLQELSRRLVELQETERKDLARELHDEVGQNLTALSINLNIIQNLLPAESASKTTDRINDSQRLVEETVERIRNVMARLRPPVLDDYGLVAALNWYSAEFMKRTGITTVLILKGEELSPRLPPEKETAMFRIAQETLSNVAKHGKSEQVTLTLENREESIRMVVDDNGMGFDPVAQHQLGAKPEWGLINMRERAESVGGQFKIETAPGKGTKIIMEVPKKTDT